MAHYAPSFNGQPIFGFPVNMYVEDVPRAKQVTGFPGIDGVEVLDLGFRYMQCVVRGTFWGNDESAVGAQLSILRGYRNAQAYPLFTTMGVTYPFAQIHSVNEIPPIHGDGRLYFMAYTAIIWIL